MERRIAGAQTMRLVKMQKRQIAAAFDFGDTWASVAYTAGRGFRISDLHETKPLAEEAARLGTNIALSRPPYSIVFAAQVVKAPAARKYKRGVEYYAALSKAGDNKYHVLLYTLEEEGAADGATAIGGPVSLPAWPMACKQLTPRVSGRSSRPSGKHTST